MCARLLEYMIKLFLFSKLGARKGAEAKRIRHSVLLLDLFDISTHRKIKQICTMEGNLNFQIYTYLQKNHLDISSAIFYTVISIN